MPFCLLSQAGVAIGMALFVSDRVPEVGDALLSATVAATIKSAARTAAGNGRTCTLRIGKRIIDASYCLVG